jgi:hypothetical protein
MLAVRVGQRGGDRQRSSAPPLLSLPAITMDANGRGEPDLSRSEGIDVGEAKSRKRRRRRPKKEVSGQSETKQTDSIDAEKQPRTRPKGSNSRPSPATIIDNLISSQFFNERRTISQIIDHCRNKLACTYKPNHISGSLTRAVRNKKLEREKNSDGQFEYFK